MSAPSDDRFREVYGKFKRNHQERRAAMLAGLPPRPPARKANRSRLPYAAGVAAMFLGLGITLFMSIRPTPAYGLDGLRERLLAMRSIYIKGWLLQRDKTKFGVATLRFPIERYFGRPSRYYSDSYGFTIGNQDELAHVTSFSEANDGERDLTISHNEKNGVLSRTDPLEAELRFQDTLQQTELDRIMSGLPQDYELVGSERLRNVWCDVYQSKAHDRDTFGARQRISINRTSGLPERVVLMSRGTSGEEEVVCEYTEIRYNVDPPANLFSFEVPKGYTVTEANEAPNSRYIEPIGNRIEGDIEGVHWVALRIDDSVVLLCWSEWTQKEGKQIWFNDKLRFVLRGAVERECTEHKLYETTSGEFRWRWSLIVPNDLKPVGFEILAVKSPDSKQGPNEMSVRPLVFSHSELGQMVERVQRRALEQRGQFDAVRSLDDLRKVIITGGNSADELDVLPKSPVPQNNGAAF